MLDLRRFTGHEMRLGEKLIEFNWGFLLLLMLIASIGFAMLYSVAEGRRRALPSVLASWCRSR
jgi:rod shape determining protein RodA